jgi:hypothetical protein
MSSDAKNIFQKKLDDTLRLFSSTIHVLLNHVLAVALIDIIYLLVVCKLPVISACIEYA